MMDAIKNMPRWRVVLFMTAIFLSSFTAMSDLMITPVFDQIYEALPGEENIVSFGISGCVLAALPCMLLAGWLCDRIDRKIVLVAGCALTCIGTVCGWYVVNAWYFTIMRLIFCAGWGLAAVSGLAIIAAVWTQEDEHGKVVGWYNCVMAIIGAVFGVIGGMLAANSSDAIAGAFSGFWIQVVFLVIIILFVPSMKPDKAEVAARKAEEAKNKSIAVAKNWWVVLIPMGIQLVLFSLCWEVHFMMVSFYVTDAGIGDEAFTGLVASVMTIASAVGAFLFGPSYAKLKKGISIPAILVVAVGFVVMGLFPSSISCLVSTFCMGYAWSTYYCYIFAHCTEICPASKGGMSTSIMNFVYAIACVFTTYQFQFVLNGLGLSPVEAWLMYGVISLAICLVSAIVYVAQRSRAANKAASDAPQEQTADGSTM